jgi:uncharacterized Zn finger protein
MPDQLSESDIRRWCGEQSFERGRGYYSSGAIVDPRRQGDTLKAKCLGTSAPSYRVEVTLGSTGILAGVCSCPVGAGGHCKHVAALLLTWLHQPKTFREVEPLEVALGRRDKAELIALIRRMIARTPDLEDLLELQVIGPGQPALVNPESIRRQARRAFAGADHDNWGAASGIAGDLDAVVDMGDDYAAQGDRRSAVVVYRTVAEEVLENYETVDDEGGELGAVVDRCVEGLAGCLDSLTDPVERETILRSLFHIYHWDVSSGGYGIGDGIPGLVLEQATAEEKERVSGWVEEAMPAADAAGLSDWKARALGGFLLDLNAGTLDDEAFLRICREARRWPDLADRLLALDRVDEAEEVARAVGDYDLLQLAEVFIRHDRTDLAERLALERSRVSQDSRLLPWLKDRAAARGDLPGVLALAEQIFWRLPALEGYRALRDAARNAGTWDQLRPQVLARLAQGSNYQLLTQIHLDEGEVDDALASLKRLEAVSHWAAGDALAIQVAKAAEAQRPHASISIYLAEAERLIAGQGRGNYQTAAGYLTRVRELYKQINDSVSWSKLMADLRERHRRLRALQDELNKAGL